MTAAEPAQNKPGHNLAREVALGGSAQRVADALIPGDRARFLGEYDRLVQHARIERDLAPALEHVERWRGVAVLQADPERYRRHLLRAAELLTGESVPEHESVDELRKRIGA